MSIIRKIINKCARLFCWIFFRMLPVQKNKVVVCSFCGRGYGDSPKYIVDELLKSTDDLKIVWIVKDEKERFTLPSSVSFCRKDSLAEIYHISTAKVWIDNCRKGARIKRRKQCYLQTWHGFALKKIEKDAESVLSDAYIACAKKDSAQIDLIVSCSKFMTQIYRNSFWYEGEIVEWGNPRNDILINNDASILLKVREYYNIAPNKRIVLYAPTFRADHSIKAYAIDYNRLKESLQNRFGGEFVILVRLHPNIVNKCSNLSFKDGEIINATYYPDMQELLLATDVCISDYSSLMFDFILTKRPCFQFATDIEEYKQDRNFYFEIDKLPFPLCKNNDELENKILSFNEKEYQSDIQTFLESVGMNMTGNASKECTEWIIKRTR